MVLILPAGIAHESLRIGERVWFDQFPRTVMGSALLASPILLVLALVAQVAASALRLAVADRTADSARPSQMERARLARSFWVLLGRALFVAQWFVAVIGVVCALTIFSGEEWGLGVAAVFGAVFAVNVQILKGIRTRWQPRWAAHYESIRSRWPHTSSALDVTIIRPEARWLGHLSRITGSLLGLAIIGLPVSMGLLALAGVLPNDIFDDSLRPVDWVVLGALALTGALLLAAALSAAAETIALDLARLRQHRVLAGALSDPSGLSLAGLTADDAAQDVLRPPLFRRVGILLALLAGLLLVIGISGWLNFTGATPAEDMALFVVVRPLLPIGAALGLLAWLLLAWGLRGATAHRTALLRAFPTIDPIPAYTRRFSTTDGQSAHRLARPGDPVDARESRRRARDAAHSVQDDD